MLVMPGQHIPRRLIFYDDITDRPDPNNVVSHSRARECRVCLESNRMREHSPKLCRGCDGYKEER